MIQVVPQTPPSFLATRHVVFPSIFDYFPTAVLTARPSPLSDTTLTDFCRKSYLAGRLCPKLCTPCTLSNSDESQLWAPRHVNCCAWPQDYMKRPQDYMYVEGHVQNTAFIVRCCSRLFKVHVSTVVEKAVVSCIASSVRLHVTDGAVTYRLLLLCPRLRSSVRLHVTDGAVTYRLLLLCPRLRLLFSFFNGASFIGIVYR